MARHTRAVMPHHAELSSLNALFIDLVLTTARGADLHAAVLGLPASIVRGLLSLSADAVGRLASRPFSLFCLGFHERERWRGRLRHGPASAAADSGPQTTGFGAFTLVALTTARQIARSDPYEAALSFGMDTGLARRLGAMELSGLPTLATLAATSLRARRAEHPVFWPGLVAACQVPGVNGADATLAMGVQLTLVDALDLAGGRTPSKRPFRLPGPGHRGA